MIPKFISNNGTILEVDITKIPIVSLLNIVMDEPRRKDKNKDIRTTISTEALQIMKTYASEGKLLICSSVLDMIETLQSWKISDELLQEISIILVTSVDEYSSIALMRIVFEEKWAVHNKIYTNVIHEYTTKDLREMKRKYIIAVNDVIPSGTKWKPDGGEARILSTGVNGYRVAAYISCILPEDIPYMSFKNLIPLYIKIYGSLYAKSYENELYVIMRSDKTNRPLIHQDKYEMYYTRNILPHRINQENLTSNDVQATSVVYTTENVTIDDILLNDGIPYIYRCLNVGELLNQKYKVTTSWLFCAMRGLNVVNNKILESNELYNYMMYPIYMSEAIPIIHVHMYPDITTNMYKPEIPIPNVEFNA